MKVKLLKLNRGLILLIIAIIGVLIYLTAETIDANKKKQEVRTLASEIITKTQECIVIVSDIDDVMNSHTFFYHDNSDFNENKENNYSNIDILKPYLYQDDRLYQEISELGNDLSTSAFVNDNVIIKSLVSRIPYETSVMYYNNTAKVTIRVNNEYISADNTQNSMTSTDELGFEYIDGRWQLVSYEIY